MNFLIEQLKKSTKMTIFLMKVTIPISLAIKILDDLGFIKLIANFFSPIMKLVGLSGELGIVWITGMVTNIYGALITLFNFSASTDFSVKEITILATMILIAHSLIPETKIMKEIGGSPLKIIGLRIPSALILGFFMNLIYSSLNIFGEKANFTWVPKNTDNSYLGFFISQFKNYLNIFLLIAALLILMEFLNKIGFIRLINKLLRPLLSPLGIGEEAITINLVSLTMGITFGAALFVDEIKKGKITQSELINSIYLMSLSHALIEDTLLMLTFGAKLSGILVTRVAFTFILIYFYNKLKVAKLKKLQENFLQSESE